MNKIREFFSQLVKSFQKLIKPLSKEERDELIVELSTSAEPKFDFFVLVVLSCSIATLGLIINSAAVIIGAMLLAPLISPIIAIGLASIVGAVKIIRSSSVSLLIGAGLVILLSYLMTLINRFLPFVTLQELPAEILARTQPTPIDLIIALAGGLAASYTLTRPNLSAALPGVAIATALMPPLCTIGIGMALNRWDVAGGATLLFVTNAIAIASASALVFFLRGFSKEVRREDRLLPRSLVLSAVLVLILLIPLSLYSIKFFTEATNNRLINTVVSREVGKLSEAQLVDLQVVHQSNNLIMVVTIRSSIPLTFEEVVNLQKSIVDEVKLPVSLKVNQVLAKELDPLVPPTSTPTISFSPTPKYTSTITPSPTPTLTPTPSPTPTPILAEAVYTGLPKLQLYQSPGGPSIGQIQIGQQFVILYGRQIYKGLLWLEVEDDEGRIGWLPAINLLEIRHTPSPAP